MESLDKEYDSVKTMQQDLDREMSKMCLDPAYESLAFLTKDDILLSALKQQNLNKIDNG